MSELLTVVTGKGQVTVPVEIRRALGIKEGDRAACVMAKDEDRRGVREGGWREEVRGKLGGDPGNLEPKGGVAMGINAGWGGT